MKRGELMTRSPLFRMFALPAPVTVDRTSTRSTVTSGASEMSTPWQFSPPRVYTPSLPTTVDLGPRPITGVRRTDGVNCWKDDPFVCMVRPSGSRL